MGMDDAGLAVGTALGPSVAAMRWMAGGKDGAPVGMLVVGSPVGIVVGIGVDGRPVGLAVGVGVVGPADGATDGASVTPQTRKSMSYTVHATLAFVLPEAVASARDSLRRKHLLLSALRSNAIQAGLARQAAAQTSAESIIVSTMSPVIRISACTRK